MSYDAAIGKSKSRSAAYTLALFTNPMMQLIDDAQGGIRYWPGVIDAATAQNWFTTLYEKAAWTEQHRPMYERIVAVPRLLASYRDHAFPPELPLTEMLQRIQAKAPAPYNGVGLNLYRDGNDSVAMHSDKLHILQAPYPIALISLGEPRRMLIRAKTGTRRTLSVDLEPGSLLCMSYASQLTHDHGIPKTKRPQGARISAVFRVRPEVG